MGSSGISYPTIGNFTVSTSAPRTISPDDSTATSAWTPPQWGQPALTILEVPAGTANTGTTSITEVAGGFTMSTGVSFREATKYVFDAVLHVNHSRSLEPTQQPVLTGAVLTEHAFLRPTRITLEIGMSDAMSQFSSGMWSGGPTKSISAWKIIKGLQESRTLVNLTTRLDSYTNLLITEANAPDDVKTLHGLRATVVFQEILAGVAIASADASARPDATQSANLGTAVYSEPVDPSQIAAHVIPSVSYPNVPVFSNVPGAGRVSSNSLSQVQNQ